MKIKNSILGVGLISIAVEASCGTIPIWTTKVLAVESYTSGLIAVVTEDQTVKPEQCSSSSKYVIPATQTGASNTLSVLMTAKVTSSNVHLYIADNYCEEGYPVITRVRLL